MTDFSNTAPGKDAEAFLDTDPPHWAARGLAYIIIFVFAAFAVASVMIKIPETVACSFVLAPVRGTDPIKAGRTGVLTLVRVSEGQSVSKGDLLMAIKSETAGDRTADLQSLGAELRGAGGSLANAKQKYESQRLSDERESAKLEDRVDHLGRMIEFKKKHLAMVSEMADSYAKLQKDGLASLSEITRRRMEVNETASEVDRLQSEQRETRAAIDKLKHESAARQVEYREIERSVNETAEKNHIRMTALKEGLSGSTGNEVAVLAPCSGAVVRLQVKGNGAMVHEGEILCELACSGEQLQAELTIPEAGVGRIKTGQGVKLFYDAFPYQRYGVRSGSLRWITPASSTPAFRALVDIHDESITVNGQPRQLLPGMTGKSEIVVGRRSLVSYAFEPIRQLKESLSATP